MASLSAAEEEKTIRGHQVDFLPAVVERIAAEPAADTIAAVDWAGHTFAAVAGVVVAAAVAEEHTH